MVMKKQLKMSPHKKFWFLTSVNCTLDIMHLDIGHMTIDIEHHFGDFDLPAVRSPSHPSSGGRAVETETIGYKDKRVHRVTREFGGRRSGIP